MAYDLTLKQVWRAIPKIYRAEGGYGMDKIQILEAVSVFAHDWGEYRLSSDLHRIQFRPAPTLTYDTLDEFQLEIYELLEDKFMKKYKKNPRRKSKARYCRERQKSPRAFDKRSFRTIALGRKGKRGIIGCPKSKWQPRKQRCKVGTRLQSILHPEGSKRCPVAGKELARIKRNPYLAEGVDWVGFIVYKIAESPKGRVEYRTKPTGFDKAHDTVHRKLGDMKVSSRHYYIYDYGVKQVS